LGATEIIGATGLALVAAGAWLVYAPAAPIFVGLVLMAVAAGRALGGR
jgi:hypothetical protein